MERQGIAANGLTLISCQPSVAAKRFIALTECLGVRAKVVHALEKAEVAFILAEAKRSREAVVVDCAGFTRASESLAEAVFSGLRDIKTDVLLLVTEASQYLSRYVEKATASRIIGVLEKECAGYSECLFGSGVSAELSGYSIQTSGSSVLYIAGVEGSFEPILSIDGAVSFCRVTGEAGYGSTYVWSTPEIFDMTKPLDSEAEFELAADKYLPAMIFLRAALGQRRWHARRASAAVIVDDPLLRRRYGALDFTRVLASAREHRYHVTLAFIPWNYWRTRRRHAQFFRRYGDVFSVCVHGNDHTAGEFSSANFEELSRKISEAQARFQAHEARTGLQHEWLMVWPQERYSIEALRALADNGHFAAVANSRCIPNDPLAQGKVRGEHLLLPAPDMWYGVPILKRHYLAEGMAKFALALFLGRPAILATHHRFFRQGTGRLEKFVETTRRLRPEVEWQSVTRSLQRLCWQRKVGESDWEARFFTNEFELESAADGRCDYTLHRRIPYGARVEAVTVDGSPVDFAIDDDDLRFQTTVEDRAMIKVECSRRSLPPPRRASKMHWARVAMRRIGSELRDYIAASADSTE